MAFGSGSQVALSLLNKSGYPLNGFEIAQNVAEVLAYDVTIRYVGMAVYCIDEDSVYRFRRTLLPNGTYTSGVLDTDFQKEQGGADGLLITNNYSTLPTVTKDTIVYCKNEYIDTNVTPNITYESGLYLYDIAVGQWELISQPNEDEYPNWEINKQYEVNDKFNINGVKYTVFEAHTSVTEQDSIDKSIITLETYYAVKQAVYDILVANGTITPDTKHLYIITDAKTTKTTRVFTNYSLLPASLTEEDFVYCKEDYTDPITNEEFKEGFYLYDLALAKWRMCNGAGEVSNSVTITPSILTSVHSNNNTEYHINSDKTVQTVGLETIEIVRSLEDITLDDGTDIFVGDVISINKFIDGVLAYEYSIVEEVLYNPFG